MIGRKVVYVAGFCIFVSSAIAASMSPNLMAVIAFRVLQGTGAAMIQANGMAILATTFPTKDRGRVIGLFMTMVGLGAIMGPIVSGIVVDTFGWRGVFMASVPLGAVSLVTAVAVLVREPPNIRSMRQLQIGFDWIGAFTSVTGLALFLLVMTNAYRVGWASPIVLIALITSFGLLVGFVFWERRAPHPMLDLELFKRRAFAFGSSASFFTFLAGTSVFSMMPFYLQGVLDMSPRTAGMFIAPAAVGFAVSGPISGILTDRISPRKVEFAGLTLLVISLVFLGMLTTQTPTWQIAFAMTLQGLGMGIFYTPNTASVLGATEQARYGVATAFLNMVRNTASVAGVGIATTIVTLTMASRGFEPSLDAVAAGGLGVENAFTQGLRIAFLALGGGIGVSVVLTLFKTRAKPDTIETESRPVGEPGVETGSG